MSFIHHLVRPWWTLWRSGSNYPSFSQSRLETVLHCCVMHPHPPCQIQRWALASSVWCESWIKKVKQIDGNSEKQRGHASLSYSGGQSGDMLSCTCMLFSYCTWGFIPTLPSTLPSFFCQKKKSLCGHGSYKVKQTCLWLSGNKYILVFKCPIHHTAIIWMAQTMLSYWANEKLGELSLGELHWHFPRKEVFCFSSNISFIQAECL